ncbi:MAG TPA: PspC domain-containing protein [Bacilli bacterium]|nr:PspC domain-containing protein [Bacilli bacterium]
MKRKFRKSATDRSIYGICGGIAEYYNISSLGVRLIFLILPLNFIIYIILANIIPEQEQSLLK